MTDLAPAPRPETLRSREHLRFAVGAVALVTLGAFENRAVGTVLPTVAGQLHGLALFGAASAAPLISYVVAMAVAGAWADRAGPAPLLRTGMVAFLLSQTLTGLAPTMAVFALGRLVSGTAEALLDVGLTVLLARTVPESLRPKVFGMFAAAWVLPSLLGPPVAGVVTEHLGWRWVFLAAVALIVPAYLLLRSSINGCRRVSREPWGAPGRRTAAAALVVAAGLAGTTSGGSLLSGGRAARASGALLILAGLVVLVVGLPHLVPRGTWSAQRGIPAVTALRALLTAAFGTTGAYLPLMLTTIHRLGPTAAGSSLTITGVCWALGSNLNGLDGVQRRSSPGTRLRLGFGLIAVGLAGPTVLSLRAMPLWAGLALWALAGLGIGICSPTLSTQLLALSPTEDQGRNTAAVGLAGSIASALALALSGAAIALAAPRLSGGLFAGIMAGAALLALTGVLVGPRAGAPGAPPRQQLPRG